MRDRLRPESCPLNNALPPLTTQADICQLGMDQRKVNVLAREYADDARPKRIKPVILSHHMMPGLLQVIGTPGWSACGRAVRLLSRRSCFALL